MSTNWIKYRDKPYLINWGRSGNIWFEQAGASAVVPRDRAGRPAGFPIYRTPEDNNGIKVEGASTVRHRNRAGRVGGFLIFRDSEDNNRIKIALATPPGADNNLLAEILAQYAFETELINLNEAPLRHLIKAVTKRRPPESEETRLAKLATLPLNQDRSGKRSK